MVRISFKGLVRAWVIVAVITSLITVVGFALWLIWVTKGTILIAALVLGALMTVIWEIINFSLGEGVVWEMATKETNKKGEEGEEIEDDNL